MHVSHVGRPCTWARVCMDAMNVASCWKSIHEVIPINFPEPFENAGTLAISIVFARLLAAPPQQMMHTKKPSSVRKIAHAHVHFSMYG